MNQKRFEITVTDEGKEMIENLIIGCFKILVAAVLTKQTPELINKD
jgi:hypothetical protein